MELSQLRTLVHVAELGSLSKAADRMRIAQPALSRQVRMLEEELGIRLFVRHGRGMVVTEQGREVLAHATRIMAELEDRSAASSPVRAAASAGADPIASTISTATPTVKSRTLESICIALVDGSVPGSSLLRYENVAAESAMPTTAPTTARTALSVIN